MNMPMPKEAEIQPTQEQQWLQIIFQQQQTIENLKSALSEVLSPVEPVGWHNDPDWKEYDTHLKNGATKKARDLMYKMRYRYGFE